MKVHISTMANFMHIRHLCILYHVHLTRCSKLRLFNHYFKITFQAYTAGVVWMTTLCVVKCLFLHLG